MATKPTVSTEWATQFTNAGSSGNPNKDEPTQAFKDFGQPEALPVDRQSLNYELNALDQWRRYFEEKTDDLSRPATTTIQGLVELATNAESQVGTDTSRVITPSSMSHKLETLGLGTEDLVDNYAGNDANTLPYTGRFFLVNAQNVPSAGNWFIDYAFTNGTNFSTGIQYAIQAGTTQRIYFRRSISSVWQPWLELYHTGNNIDARQYGIGINEQDKDNDTVVGTQIFRSRTDQGATLPTGISSAHTLYMQRTEDGQASQLIVEDSGALPNDPYMGFRVRGNGTGWGDFFEVLHTGSISRVAASQAQAEAGKSNDVVMTPNRTRQAYTQWGLGSEASNDVTDWNNAVRNGFYRSVGANRYINSPDNSASGWQGIVSSLDSNSKRQLVWRGGGDGNYQMWTRERFQGSWTPWIQLITEQNIGAYIPNQVTWEKRTSASLPINSKNFLDIDTVSTFTLPELSLANDMDFVTIRPSTSNKTPANFTFTINCFAGDSMRTRDLDKNIVSDTTLTVDLMTEITFIKNGGFWEY
mgnify:CR=1 FL=1